MSPFNNIEILKAINCLKIYIGFADNLDAFTPLNKTINENIIEDFKPVFKITGSRITTISIFITLPNNIMNNLNAIQDILWDIIPHEIKHILDVVVNQQLMNKTGALNAIIENLKKQINWDILNELDVIKNNKLLQKPNNFLWFIEECLYYTQKSEISAYLETTYNEFTTYNIHKSNTFNTYVYLYETLIYVIKNKEKLYNKHKTIIDPILNDLNSIYTQKRKYTFNTILNFWK